MESKLLLSPLDMDELTEKIAASVIEQIEDKLNTLQPDSKDPMSIEQLCDFINYSRPSIYKFLADHNLPGHKRGGRWYFFKDEVLGWLKSRI